MCIRVARIAPIEQTSSTLKKYVDPGPSHLWPRQPYAAAVLDLSNVIGESHGVKILTTDDIRNDLYVTLLQGDLHGGKGSDKNIEVRITVVDAKGIVENSIVVITADGIRWSTTYQSLVFYHDDKPKWNESIKVQIPENIDQNIHLRMTFHHKKTSDKTKQEKGPFALSFVRIMEDATLIRDGLHELLIYKVIV
ncbi:unnamed protein product [Brugia timori]|uniref:C2 DOCK-type domain-containing protein n=1 Tax=Brugia timori TaxID=42155 RepID=A0A3P7TNZ8_9BILA|nr:unnamed protein product [Brugia timori]